MWLDIKLFVPPTSGNRRYDLIVRRGMDARYVRVPGCFWHQRTQRWGNPWYDRNRVPCLRKGDVPIYWMAEAEYPHDLDLDRRK